MENYFYSKRFDYRGTDVPCVFTFDPQAELLWLQPCEQFYIERGHSVDTEEFDRVSLLCGAWGRRECSSLAQANRLIQRHYPVEWSYGICFPEISED